MRTLFFILAFGLFCSLYGGTLHCIFIINTEEDRFGGKEDLKRVKELSSDIARNLGFKLLYHPCTGKGFSKDIVRKTVDILEVESDDIIFLYVSSHGYSYVDQNDEFPWTILIENPTYSDDDLEENSVSFTDLVDKLQKKNPRLLIGLIDACNTYNDDNYVPANLRQPSKPITLPYKVESLSLIEAPGPNQEVYEYLFKDIEGQILVSSSKYGAYAYSGADGGVFTKAFLETFQAYMYSKQNVSWYNILRDSAVNTDTLFQVENKQEPYFQIEIHSVGSTDLLTEYEEVVPILIGGCTLILILLLPDIIKGKLSYNRETANNSETAEVDCDIDRYKNLLALGETREVITGMFNLSLTDKARNDLIGISASFEQLERDLTNQVLKKEEERKERKTINHVLIGLLDRIRRKRSLK